MDRVRITDHLAQAERHVAQGEKHVRRQKEIVDKLTRAGHDTAVAKDLLLVFERTQATQIADRDRLERGLAAL